LIDQHVVLAAGAGRDDPVEAIVNGLVVADANDDVRVLISTVLGTMPRGLWNFAVTVRG